MWADNVAGAVREIFAEGQRRARGIVPSVGDDEIAPVIVHRDAKPSNPARRRVVAKGAAAE